jgi:hypothetical protein
VIILILGAIAIFGAGFGLGVVISKSRKSTPKLKKKEPRILRKGVIEVSVRWRPNGYANYRNTTVLVVLHELERVVDQSRVVIAHVDDAPNDFVRKIAINKIGSYVKTDTVAWDEPIKQPRDVHEELTEYLERLESGVEHDFNPQDDLDKVVE